MPEGRFSLRVGDTVYHSNNIVADCMLFDSTRRHWLAPSRGRSLSEEQLHRSSTRTLQPKISVSGGSDANSPVAIDMRRLAPGRESALENGPNAADSPPSESDFLARTALSRFFHNGIDFSDWHIFQVGDDFRLAYIGTTVSNMTHLAELRRTCQDSACQQPFVEDGLWQQLLVRTGVDLNKKTAPPLHYPYPQIRPLSHWNPQVQTMLHSAQDLASDLPSFPVQETRAALVKAYFEHIHPLFPLLTPSTFLHPDGTLRESSSPLLYQAVLLPGAQVCSHPRVVREKARLQSILLRRASMLFHLRHEKDRLHLTQAALLFTWHVPDGDTVAGGPWY